MALEAIKRGYIEVDFDNGVAYAKRFWGKKLGCINKGGYRVFTLHIDGFRKQIKLHRLMWIAKNGLPPTGSLIDHINRNKLDNRLENLRMVDAKENSNNRREYTGINNPAAKIDFNIAQAIRREYKSICSYRKTAKKFNISASLVAQIIRGERWLS